MKNIIILNVYGLKNIGDEAIQISAFFFLEAALKASRESARIHVYCEDAPHFPTYSFPHLTISPHYSPYGYVLQKNHTSSLSKFFLFGWVCATSLFFALLGLISHRLLPQTGFYSYVRHIATSDKVIGIGGGYLISKSSLKDFFGLGLTLLPILIAKIYHRDLLHLPISFGPFALPLHRTLAYFSLKNTTVFCRETISLSLLCKCDYAKSINTFLFPDLALFLPPPAKSFSHHKNTWILTAREWLAPKKQARYEAALVTLINTLWKKFGLTASFMVMVHNPIEDDDTKVYARLVSRIAVKQSLTLIYPKNHQDAQSLLARASFVVATRMHSSILALTVNTPFLTIGYGHKSLGIIQSLNLRDWYIDIASVNKTNLVSLTESFIKPNNLALLRQKLKVTQSQLLKQKPLLMEKLNIFLND